MYRVPVYHGITLAYVQGSCLPWYRTLAYVQGSCLPWYRTLAYLQGVLINIDSVCSEKFHQFLRQCRL